MKRNSDLATLILCGGRGTRAYPHTLEIPKPLIDVAGKPILRHVMEIYAEQGFRRFILAAGYRADLISDFSGDLPESWLVDVVDTGESSTKGDRVLACRERLGERFFVTYGDGLGNVDINDLLSFHNAHGRAATVTVVPLQSQYGTLEVDDMGRVTDFIEKPQLRDHWINAGFFVMESRVFEHWTGDLETEVLPALGASGELFGYRHEGFWKSMDTFKDAQDLNAIATARKDRLPWLSSAIRASS